MKALLTVAALAGATMMAGCGGDVAETLGLGKQSPDEFTVVRRAPLSVPPDMRLRPPRPGQVADNRITSEESVRETVFGRSDAGRPLMAITFDDLNANGGVGLGPSAGELALLESANADSSLPGIRGIVDAETGEKVESSEYLLDKIIFWRDGSGDQVVDAGAERERLENDAAAGRVSTGEGAATTTARGKTPGLLDAIF